MQAFECDGVGRITRATDNNNGGATAVVNVLAYDSLGNELSDTTPADTTRFIYDGPNVIEEQQPGFGTTVLLADGVCFVDSESFGSDDSHAPLVFANRACEDAPE